MIMPEVSTLHEKYERSRKQDTTNNFLNILIFCGLFSHSDFLSVSLSFSLLSVSVYVSVSCLSYLSLLLNRCPFLSSLFFQNSEGEMTSVSCAYMRVVFMHDPSQQSLNKLHLVVLSCDVAYCKAGHHPIADFELKIVSFTCARLYS